MTFRVSSDDLRHRAPSSGDRREQPLSSDDRRALTFSSDDRRVQTFPLMIVEYKPYPLQRIAPKGVAECTAPFCRLSLLGIATRRNE